MSPPSPVARRKGLRAKLPRADQRASHKSPPAPQPTAPSADALASAQLRVAFAILLAGCGIWSYWPTLENLVTTWIRVADYAHGFLVIPLAVYFLFIHRDSFPGFSASSPWLAIGFLILSLALRHAGDFFHYTFLDGWSLLPWVAALCALLGGIPLLRWCWPSLLFLVFMVPLPFSLETELSGPLQRIATMISTQILQFLGRPAFAEGNVIQLGDQRLEVAQACSGLRLFLGIVALTYAYVVVLRRPLWEKLVLIVATAPIAIAANVGRIVATGLLYELLPGPAAHAWIHDGAGWAMILFAAGLFWLLLVYLRKLVKEEQVMDMVDVVKLSRV